MDYKYIEQLIDRYFDCATSIAEERILKAFFSQEDVPSHLEVYADIFRYEEESLHDTLGEDFDQRVISRLQHDGDAPAVHVHIKKLTFADRIRPLWRAAAAVAIVVLVGGSLHKAYTIHPIEPISQFGTEEGEAVQPTTIDGQEFNPNQFIQEGEKVAITTDTIGA